MSLAGRCSEDMADLPRGVLDRLRRAKRVSVFTGAGVSAESGIPTFRGEGGMWEKADVASLATPEGFERDPRTAWEWYRFRQMEIKKATPNPAHVTIAEMEDYYESFAVLTQNIDGLHARAGSRHIVELHGNIWRVKCTRDGECFAIDAPVDELLPLCQCGAILRPDVVWFGEPLPAEAVERASEIASRSEAMFVVGTSAVVYPAAALPVLAKNSDAFVIEVNLEPSGITHIADISFFGRAGEIMPALWKRILGTN